MYRTSSLGESAHPRCERQSNKAISASMDIAVIIPCPPKYTKIDVAGPSLHAATTDDKGVEPDLKEPF